MVRRLFFGIFFVILFTSISAHGAEDISFKGTNKSTSGEPLTLTGKLYKPKGDYAFPAVLIMHDCAGIHKGTIKWAEKISSWNYVTLILDSFGPRGQANVCEKLDAVTFHGRVRDAFDAKAYLSQLPFVNPKRIGIMGMSHGACTTLASLSQSNLERMFWFQGGGSEVPLLSDYLKQTGPFQVAIALYPWCAASLKDNESPLLILIGDKDTWTPASFCKTYMPNERTKHEIVLKIYEGGTHPLTH